MVRVRFQKIVWGGRVEKHITKHGVSIQEVEKVINSDALIKEGYLGRKILTQKVETRLLSVVAMKGNKVYIVTARDASDKERLGYYEFEKNKKV